MNFSHCLVVAFQKYLRDNALHGPISGCKLHVTAAGCGQIKITIDTIIDLWKNFPIHYNYINIGHLALTKIVFCCKIKFLCTW